jgi:hypothetical protein
MSDELTRLREENHHLKRLVFESQPFKRKGIFGRLLSAEKPGGFGGAPEYEVWLRSLEDPERLVDLYTSAIDALRYRRRFVRHEIERRCLHSSYGIIPAEFLFEEKRHDVD